MNSEFPSSRIPNQWRALVGQTFLSVVEAASAGFFGGADILVCHEAASAGYSPPSRLELAREKSTSPLANSMADKNVCPTSALLLHSPIPWQTMMSAPPSVLLLLSKHPTQLGFRFRNYFAIRDSEFGI